MRAAIFVCAVLLAGCARSGSIDFFPAPELAATGTATAAGLAASGWANEDGVYFIRQSALFEFGAEKIPMAAFMRLDLAGGTARLVGLNDLGLKLFDIEVLAGEERQRFLLPGLAHIPDFAGRIAVSLRRIFLSPRPLAGDTLHIGVDSYRLTRTADGGRTEFVFGGVVPLLLEKMVANDHEDWRVRYFLYQPDSGSAHFPGGVVLDDHCAGFRLSLWLLEVTKKDE